MGVFGGSQLSWNTLAVFNRSLGTMLHSGVNILKSFQVAGAQSLDLKLQNATEFTRAVTSMSSEGEKSRAKIAELEKKITELEKQLADAKASTP